jgi:mediator of RNA polymerase II transcription subunit 16
VFVRSAGNPDVLALLFKLLSRLAQTSEPDENLLDECCLLPSQVMIPQLNPSTKIVAVASPALFYQSLPLQLEFGVKPESLQFVPELNPVEVLALQIL